MAQPFMPIWEGNYPKRSPDDELQQALQLELARAESQLGNFAEAARLRGQTLFSARAPIADRQDVLEELVRDLFCSNQLEQSKRWAEQLDEPVRSIYLASERVGPKSIDMSNHSHRLFYLAIGIFRPQRRRKLLSMFLSQRKQMPSRVWEVLEARKLATELCRKENAPFCVLCCRNHKETTLIIWTQQCADCAKLTMEYLAFDQEKVQDVRAVSKFFSKPMREEARVVDQDAPPVSWSQETLSYLERACQLGPAPWTSLDLLAVLEGVSVPRDQAGEPVSEDGLHSRGWLQTTEIAEWLARCWYDPGPVSVEQLRLALCWAEVGRASQVMQAGRWRRKMSFEFRVRLPLGELRRLEGRLLVTPEDPFLRAALMVGHGTGCEGRSAKRCRRELMKHANWFLENRPDHPAALDIRLDFWPDSGEVSRKVVQLVGQHPEDLRMKELAANIFHYRRPRLAVELLSRTGLDSRTGMERSLLWGEVGDWSRALYFARESLAMGGDRDRSVAQLLKALAELKDWKQLEIEAREKADVGSNSEDWGRQALALAALGQGRGEEAEDYLLNGEGFTRWPVTLFKALLEAGRTDAVLEYLSRRLDSSRGRGRKYLRTAMQRIRRNQPVDWYMFSIY